MVVVVAVAAAAVCTTTTQGKGRDSWIGHLGKKFLFLEKERKEEEVYTHSTSRRGRLIH